MKDFNDELLRVVGLIDRAETLMNWSYQLVEEFEVQKSLTMDRTSYLRSGRAKLMVMQINLYFQDALLCIHTVLFGDTKENKEEIGLPYIRKSYPDRILATNPRFDARLKRVQNKYDNTNLGHIRHKIVAHKDLLTSGDAMAHFLNRFRSHHIDNLNVVIRLLKTLVRTYDVPRNNVFEDFYQQAFETFKRSIT